MDKTKIYARGLVFIIAISATGLFIFQSPAGFPVDDSYIHLCYARNLAQFHEFSFNRGEPSLGTSSPLWVILLSFGALLGNAEATAKAISLICFLLCAAILYDLLCRFMQARCRSLSRNWILFFSIAGPALFCVSGNLLWISFSGMESMLYLFLGLLALRSMKENKINILTGLALGLLILTRVNGLTLAAVLCIFILLKKRPLNLKNFYPFIITLLLIAPWYIYSWTTFHALMPYTRGGKLASHLFNSGFSIIGAGKFMLWHLVYLWRWDIELLASLIIGLIWFLTFIFSALKTRQEQRPNSDPAIPLLCLWAALDFCFHAFFFRSTYTLTPYQNMRYQAAMFAALPASAAAALVLAADFAARRGKSKWISFVTSGLSICLIVFSAAGIPSWIGIYSNNVLHLNNVHQAAAKWIRQNLPKDARLAGFDIGSLKYFSDRYVLDLGGLIDPAIHPYLEKRGTGPFLIARGATHYVKMVLPDAENITGVEKDNHLLYNLIPFSPPANFYFAAYVTPVFLHSRGMEIYRIDLRKP